MESSPVAKSAPVPLMQTGSPAKRLKHVGRVLAYQADYFPLTL